MVYEGAGKISQLVILAWHTEGLMNQGAADKYVDVQDQCWNLAAALSGHALPVNEDYFMWWVGEKAKEKTVSATSAPITVSGQPPINRVMQLILFERLSGLVLPRDEFGDSVTSWMEKTRF